MNKRIKKKMARDRCPKCRTREGIVQHYQLRSGKWVALFIYCFECDWKLKEGQT